MAIGAVEELHAILHRPRLGVGSGVNHAPQPGMSNRPGTHGAGLESHIEVAAIEPPGPSGRQRRTDRHQFGMGGGVGELPHAVALGGEDALALHHHGTHGRFAGGGGFCGEVEGEVHWGGHISH